MIVAGIAMLVILYSKRNGPARADRLYGVASILAVAVVICGSVVLFLGARQEGGVRPHAVAGADDLLEMDLRQPADDFEYLLVDDETTVRLSDLKGKVVILNVWATWCAPCLTEIPELNRLQERYADDGLVIVSLSDESPAELRAFESSLALTTVSATVRDVGALPRPIRKAFEIRPTTYIIDRNGDLRRYILGARNYSYFEQAVLPHL